MTTNIPPEHNLTSEEYYRSMGVPTPAQANRRILANAHAAWIATSKNPKVDAVHNLQRALVQAETIGLENLIYDIQNDGTTLLIILQSKEILELDAYGNILRGQP